MDIRLLGPVEIWVGARELAAGTPKQRCVLAVLALHAGERVSMEALIDRVWGDAPPGAVSSAVYAYVARLRRLLAHAGADAGGSPALQWRGRGYLLDIDPAAVDLHRSRTLAARARAAAAAGDDARAAPLWRQALDPWRGEPLGGLSGYWAGRTRAALEQERLALLADRFGAELRLGEPTH